MSWHDIKNIKNLFHRRDLQMRRERAHDQELSELKCADTVRHYLLFRRDFNRGQYQTFHEVPILQKPKITSFQLDEIDSLDRELHNCLFNEKVHKGDRCKCVNGLFDKIDKIEKIEIESSATT